MANKKNKIGEDFTTWGLFMFALPSFCTNIISTLFRSLDDALFLSRYVGEKALSGVKIIMPLSMVQMALSHLFYLGSSNISARLMGEGKQAEAKQVFMKIVISSSLAGIVFALLVNLCTEPLLQFFKVSAELEPYALLQIRYVLSIAPIVLVNSVFSAYYSTAGKPKLGTLCSIINGFMNIALDVLLVVKLQMGVLGVCIATVAGELAVFMVGLIFYANKKHEIHFVVPHGEYIQTCLQSFEYALPQSINSLTISLVSIVTNNQLLAIIGDEGIAANAIINDVRSIIVTGLIGISVSVSPVVSYNYGNKNPKKLTKTLKSIFKIWLFGSLALMFIGFIIDKPLVNLFMSKNSSQAFFDMTLFGLFIETVSVPFSAGCVVTSVILLALGNTKASTILSILRNLVIKVIVLIVLPSILGDTGIWLAFSASEFLSFLICIYLLYINRDNYGYGKSGKAKLIEIDK